MVRLNGTGRFAAAGASIPRGIGNCCSDPSSAANGGHRTIFMMPLIYLPFSPDSGTVRLGFRTYRIDRRHLPSFGKMHDTQHERIDNAHRI